MGRHSKYSGDPYGPQKAYFQTPKGKAAVKKYESSEKGKDKKRNWARKQRANKVSIDRKQHFIDTYGDIEIALKLLDKREKFVVIHLNGLDGNPPMTQEAVGQELFLTGSRIGQIKTEAEKKLIPLKKTIEEDADPENSSPTNSAIHELRYKNKNPATS